MPIFTNPDAELSILGHFLLTDSRLDIFQKLDEKYFVTNPAKEIYRGLKTCIDQDLEPNFLNVKVDNNDLLIAVSKASLGSVESSFYLILEAYMTRQAQEMGLKLASYIEKSDEAKAIIKYLDVLLVDYHNQQDHKENIFHISSILPNLFQEIKEEGYQYNFNISGLENMGVKPSHLVSVVARTKSGKTSFLTQVAIDVLHKNKSVLFCSLEVNELEIGTKLLACQANVNPVAITNYGQIDQSENNTTAIVQAIKDLENKPLEVYKSAECYIAELKSKITEFCKNHENPVIFIDQLQFIRSGKKFDSKINEYDYIMQEIKSIAGKTNSMIFLAHQLNRDIERRDGKFPQTSDIKDCGRIEEISDLVLMFAKSSSEKDENRYCTIISRHMQSGKVVLDWNTKRARFYQTNEFKK